MSQTLKQLFNLEAEMSMLGAAILSERAARWMCCHMEACHWYRPAHRTIFLAIQTLVGEGMGTDLTTVSALLKQRGVYADVGGEDYLVQIAEYVVSPANSDYYGKIVIDLWRMRELENRARELIGAIHDTERTPDDALATAFSLPRGLSGIGTDTMFGANYDPTEPGIEPLSTGLHRLDKCGPDGKGWPGSEPSMLGARPGRGKSALLCQFCLHALQSGRRPAFATLEMPARKIFDRLVQQQCGWSKKPQRTHLQGAYEEAVENVRRWNMPIWDPAEQIGGDDSIQSFVAWAHDIHDARQLTEIYVDYFQLFTAKGRFDNRTRELDFVSAQIRMLSKRLRIPIIVAAQLSMNQKGEERPADSIKIENDSALIVMLRMDTQQADELRNWDAKAVVTKSRHGKTTHFPLEFQRSWTRFNEQPWDPFTEDDDA